MSFYKLALSSLLDLFYPQMCVCCNVLLYCKEDVICTQCIFNIPRTNYHLSNNNKLDMVFWARVCICNSGSFFYFNKKSIYQNLIHKFKYNNRVDIGLRLSKLYGLDLLESSWISEIDVIIPVPLHVDKQKERGFNQSLVIAQGISAVTEIPICSDNLVRNINSSSQTNKSRLERWQNVDSIFYLLNSSELNGKHILLIDDVVTTGSTLEACAQVLLSSCTSINISVATLASA